MELKDKKKIMNNRYPGYSNGFSDVLGAGLGLGGMVVGGPVGGLMGGLGSLISANNENEKAKEEEAKARLRDLYKQEMSNYENLTDTLRKKQSDNGYDTKNNLLFGYKNGKPGILSSISDYVHNATSKLVHTAEGIKQGEQNSWTEKGETIWDGNRAHYVNEGPNDGAPSNVKKGDTVFGKEKNPFTGNTFKKDAEPIAIAKEMLDKSRPSGKGWLGKQTKQVWEQATAKLNDRLSNALENLNQLLNAVLLNKKFKCGKPAYAPGKPDWELSTNELEKRYGLIKAGNLAPSIVNGVAALQLYFTAKNDTPLYPDTYIPNRYANKSLSLLGSLRIDPYSTIQSMREAEGRTNFATEASGGLSTAQKNLMRISSLAGTQQLIGNMLNSIKAQNLQYQANYANALMNHGLSEAQRLEAAKRYDLEYYSKAHAARQQMMQNGLYNFADTYLQYAANEFKRKNAIANLNLYTQQQKIDSAKLDAWLKGQEKNNTVVNNWTGAIPYVLSPDILDNIPGAVNPPAQEYKPDPNQWGNLNKSKTSWLPTNNPLYKYWG